jgi:hypothetical protein
MGTDLEKIYAEVIGGAPLDTSGDSDLSSDQGDSGEAPTEKSVGDAAYKQPKYDGTGGDRDPREDFIEDDDKPWEEGDPEPEENENKASSKKSEDKSEDEFEPIPDHLVEAGRLSGLSDDEIVKLAENQPGVLEKMAKNFAEVRNLSRSDVGEKVEKKKAEADKEEDLPNLDLEIDEDELDENGIKMAKYLKTVVPSLTKKIKALEAKLQTHEKDIGGVKEVAQAEAIRRIDSYFDQRAEDLPALGNVKSLTESQKQARIAVHSTAVMLQRGSDGQIKDEQALSMAIAMVRGQISDSKNKAKIISDLSSRKQRFMARPSHGKKPLIDNQRGKSSEEERVLDVIEEKLSKIR